MTLIAILAVIGAASLIFSAAWVLAGLVFDATVKMPDDFEDAEALKKVAAEFAALEALRKNRRQSQAIFIPGSRPRDGVAMNALPPLTEDQEAE